MSTDLELVIPVELELLMAQELAVALIARHVGFRIEPVKVEWYIGCSRPRPLPSVSGIHLLTSDSPEERRSYIEKRIAVLSARAYATTLVLGRKDDAEGCAQNPELFWQIFSENGDHSRAVELCAAYLIEDTDKPNSCDPDADFINSSNQYLLHHGLRAVAEVLTEPEFLSFVDAWVSNFKRSSGSFQTTISTELLENYKPGLSTLKIIEGEIPAEQLCDMSSDLTFSKRMRDQEDYNQARRCLVAHELGHWLAARYEDVPTSGVEFEWEECGGSCTVHLGLPVFQWPLGRYLNARIAVLCAGSFADCWMRYPESRSGIGSEFYKTLYFGTGVDDFAKLTELYLLYRTIQPSPAAQRGLASPPNSSEILASLNTLLEKSGVYQTMISPEFEELVTHLNCKAQEASTTSISGPLKFIKFKTEELDDACTEYGLSRNCKLTTTL